MPAASFLDMIEPVISGTLSTVALPLFEIGRTAANLMLDILSGEGEQARGERLLQCGIIERESTGGGK